ncbi:MAG: NAD(P)-dependent alcohol dehydrogenase [Deltaproteobacteria bacterium]|nr:NAD(P)-dependent alcohol dehydrogenase [Myxococcales bacterium]MDP3219271.1 NAD(P)-dependent alcohol dehydrogenase [Deltaproteobacteria bacterium]
MRAAVVTRYGAPDVLTLREVARPTPGPRDLLIRIKAATVSSGDARVRARRVPEGMGLLVRLALGWSGPRQPILGTECAGVVEAVGAGVTRFRVGDAVVAFLGAAMGAHAGYVCVREDGAVAPKPEALSWDEASALLFGGTTALHYLRAARLKPGERVLVLGASGAVGVAAVQLARHDGAEVTAVCSAANASLVTELGAARVIDYHAEDFTRGDARWDVVMDCVGATDYARCRRVLAPGGRLLRVVCGLGGQLAAPWQGRLSGHRVIAGVAAERPEDVRRLVELARDGVYRAVIDASMPLSRIAEAHARVDSGHKRGSVVVTLEGDP